jgi:hypothetical protein
VSLQGEPLDDRTCWHSSTSRQMSRQTQTGLSIDPLVCSFCGKSLKLNRYQFTKHEQSCAETSGSDRTKPCLKCGKWFKTSKGGLIKHERACKGSKKIPQEPKVKLGGPPDDVSTTGNILVKDPFPSKINVSVDNIMDTKDGKHSMPSMIHSKA